MDPIEFPSISIDRSLMLQVDRIRWPLSRVFSLQISPCFYRFPSRYASSSSHLPILFVSFRLSFPPHLPSWCPAHLPLSPFVSPSQSSSHFPLPFRSTAPSPHVCYLGSRSSPIVPFVSFLRSSSHFRLNNYLSHFPILSLVLYFFRLYSSLNSFLFFCFPL